MDVKRFWLSGMQSSASRYFSLTEVQRLISANLNHIRDTTFKIKRIKYFIQFILNDELPSLSFLLLPITKLGQQITTVSVQ